MKKATTALVIALLLMAPASSFAANHSPQRMDFSIRDAIATRFMDMVASAAVLYGDCKAVASAAVLWGDYTQPDQSDFGGIAFPDKPDRSGESTFGGIAFPDKQIGTGGGSR